MTDHCEQCGAALPKDKRKRRPENGGGVRSGGGKTHGQTA